MRKQEQNGTGMRIDLAAFVCDQEGRAVDMVMTDPKTQFPDLLRRVNDGTQPATDDFKERINAYHPQ